MKLTFIENFTLELEDRVLKGTFRELTKEEKKTLKDNRKSIDDVKKESDKLVSKLTLLENKKKSFEDQGQWESVQTINEEIDTVSQEINKTIEVFNDGELMENIFKKRLEISLGGEDKEEILEIGRKYSYQKVMETIERDIEEKRGNDLTAS